MSGPAKRALVTGATGFIGNRLVEELVRNGWEVAALVNRFMNASRLARFPVRMLGGSILDARAVARAMEGVDTVFHLAVGTHGSAGEIRSATVAGTRIVCEAALAAGARRVVHASTFSVYGAGAGGTLAESTAREPDGDAYGEAKLEAENLVLALHRERQLPVVVLQPTIVYGPFAFWSAWPIDQLRQGTVVLPDDGGGFCNPVYIDDVVSAFVRAAAEPGIEGETFLVSGARPCTWLEYYQAYARFVPGAQIAFEPGDAIRTRLTSSAPPPTLAAVVKRGIASVQVREEILAIPAVRTMYRAIKSAVPRPAWQRVRNALRGPVTACESHARPRSYPMVDHLDLYRSTARVSIEKAVRRLAWQPRIDLAEGTERTAAWARWAGMLA